MAKKHSASRAGSAKHAPRSKRAGREEDDSITDALVGAVVEIGHAAEHVKSSLEHAANAREKGKGIIVPVRRAGKKTIEAVRKRLPGRKR